MKKTILVYGAGPFGSLFAERLTEAGHSVSLLDRGQRQQDLKAHGIVIENFVTGEQTITRIPVVERLGEEDAYDLVIVSMRKNQALDILAVLAANKNVKTFLFMMNNAAGQQELVKVLGKERVMAGFPLPGGFLDGHIVRMLPVDEKKPMALPIGETDGRVTERTREIAEILGSMRGYQVDIRRDMDDWLKTHVALLVPSFVPAVYACGMDAERFAGTRDARVLSFRALREALLALDSVGVAISPAGLRRLKSIPEPVFVFLLGQLAKTQTFQNALGDLKTKPDEIEHLANEFFELIRPSTIKTPAIDQLSGYIFQDKEPMALGKKNIALNWNGIYILIGGAALAVALYKAVKK